MGLSDEQLIHEAVECNHAGVGPRHHLVAPEGRRLAAETG